MGGSLGMKRNDAPPTLRANEDEPSIRLGKVIFSENWRYENITIFAYIAPIAFWMIASIVLHKLGTRDILNASFVYPVIFAPFFIFVPIAAVALHLSNKLFGNFTERKQEWDSKTTSAHFQDALTDKDYRKAKRLVIYQVLTFISNGLLGWFTGAIAFWIFVY